MKNTKFLKPIVALTLVAAMAVGGSLAYITNTTEKIDNKFQIATPGASTDFLDIDLDETFKLEGVTVTDNTAKFLPGEEITKAPVVSIKKLNMASITGGAYIFVELTGEVDNVLGLGFAVNTTDWDAVPGADNVYYMLYTQNVDTTAVDFAVFSTDTITIDTDYNDATFDSLQTLSVQAYAIQENSFDGATAVADAWAAVKTPATTPTV